MPIDALIQKSWYVGNDLYSGNKGKYFWRKPRIHTHTIEEQIQDGIKNHYIQYDYHTIREMFKVSKERVKRNIEFVSGERWRASVAIGFAQGKDIFCYPWMNTRDIERCEEEMFSTIRSLIDHNKIIIVPTTKEENINRIFPQGHIVKL